VSGVKDPAHIASWLGIAGTIAAGAMGYGILTQRVAANEAAVKDARPIAERIARLEANQDATQRSVDGLASDVKATNALLVQMLAEQRVAAKAAADAATAAQQAARAAERAVQ